MFTLQVKQAELSFFNNCHAVIHLCVKAEPLSERHVIAVFYKNILHWSDTPKSGPRWASFTRPNDVCHARSCFPGGADRLLKCPP